MSYPFFPIIPKPGGPVIGGGGFGGFSEGGGGEAEAEGAGGADGDAPGGAAGSETGDAGAAGASDADADSSEGAEGAEGDNVTTESLGGGSGAPGTGGSASEGFFNNGQAVTKTYTQTFVITNNGGANARIRSITFTTPTGISHSADLTDLGGSATFTDSLYPTSTIVGPGLNKTFTVGYTYQFGGLGTRRGSVVIKGNGGIELRSNITLVVSQSGATAGGSSTISGVGTGGGGSSGGYVPPAESIEPQGATAGTSLTALEDPFSQQPVVYYTL